RQIQLLLCDQQLDIPASKRWRNRGVNQRLSKGAAGEAKYPGRIFTCSMSALDSSRRTQFHVWPDNRPKHESTAGGLFQIRFRLLNRRIFFECRVQNAVE